MAKMGSESMEGNQDIGGLKSLFSALIEDAAEGTGGLHTVYYTIDELKIFVNSPMDNVVLQKIKRYMHLITCNNLPGEIFRTYPVKKKPNTPLNVATLAE